MKLRLDLPEWVEERNVRVMAGYELVAYRLQGEKVFHLKTARCSHCGDCCRGLSKNWRYGTTGEDRTCVYLEKQGTEYWCTKDPLSTECLQGLQGKGRHPKEPNCTVEYVEIQ